jgi:hypothetical protein
VKAGDLKDRNAQLFVSLIIGLVQAAYVQLGKVKNEISGKIEKQLEGARITIDTLAALEDRTKGNLSAEEAEILRRALAELRLNFVDEIKKDAAGQVAATTPAAPDAPAAEAAAEPAAPAPPESRA